MANKRTKPMILESQYESDSDYEFDPSMYEAIDPTYTPGYSEIVQANSIAKADDLKFMVQHEKTGITKRHLYENIIKCDPRPLPFVFRSSTESCMGSVVRSPIDDEPSD